jgi:hypothetical protein
LEISERVGSIGLFFKKGGRCSAFSLSRKEQAHSSYTRSAKADRKEKHKKTES